MTISSEIVTLKPEKAEMKKHISALFKIKTENKI